MIDVVCATALFYNRKSEKNTGTFMLFDAHDQKASPWLMHGEAHTLVTHLL
jgi:hypothetical protein